MGPERSETRGEWNAVSLPRAARASEGPPGPADPHPALRLCPGGAGSLFPRCRGALPAGAQGCGTMRAPGGAGPGGRRGGPGTSHRACPAAGSAAASAQPARGLRPAPALWLRVFTPVCLRREGGTGAVLGQPEQRRPPGGWTRWPRGAGEAARVGLAHSPRGAAPAHGSSRGSPCLPPPPACLLTAGTAGWGEGVRATRGWGRDSQPGMLPAPSARRYLGSGGGAHLKPGWHWPPAHPPHPSPSSAGSWGPSRRSGAQASPGGGTGTAQRGPSSCSVSHLLQGRVHAARQSAKGPERERFWPFPARAPPAWRHLRTPPRGGRGTGPHLSGPGSHPEPQLVRTRP